MHISWEENFIFGSYFSISFVIRGCTISQIKIKDKVVGKKVITLEKGFSHNRYPEPTLHILFYWFPMLLLIPKEAINDMVFRHRKMMQYQMWKYAGDIIYILLSFLWRKIKLKYGTMEILFSCRGLRNLNDKSLSFLSLIYTYIGVLTYVKTQLIEQKHYNFANIRIKTLRHQNFSALIRKH